MATELLAIGNTAAASAEIVVATGSPVTVGMKGGNGYPVLSIDLKDDLNNWHSVGNLDQNRRAVSISGAGTYRISRAAGDPCGAYRA